uniref:Integrator complex subunit 11 n=1 Tax=Ciona intestinalis TaxID=7719 RepID=F6QZB5_CIOIN|nr:integrator complex subunit 11-like [Ciona intestinalis]|eukprot:XP_002128796.2 integrator complex subunit 11-like [Ciona intestinalis]
MPEIKLVPLGAGQDVGRSCIIVTLGGKNIMLDCGMHMGFNDERRFPYFDYITGGKGTLTEHIDCVIISHFHLDHCGALPYMSEMKGYDGPIYMTHPTKAICPILLEDYRKITVDRKGETNFFDSKMIKDCMKKVIPVNLHQTIHVDDQLEIKAYYAGHVLGAAMFLLKVGTDSVLYTGDYNMTPDRHLGAAWVDKCRPDVLITESTYATTIRDSKRCRERDFLKKVHERVEDGGKVLIPVFALGRAQELCILLESYWDRMNLKVPIYFSAGLTNKATEYYKLFITWTNQKIKDTFVERNMFDFKHIKEFNRSYIDNPGPMVVFATPGMLHGGLSLEIFKRWCTNEKNMIIMPGYCVAGTVGNKILSGMRKIELKPGQIVEIKMQVEYMSFSAHADAKGIMQLIRMCEPSNVMLVHGEAGKMDFLKSKINQELHLPCFKPANGETVVITTNPPITVDASTNLLRKNREILGTSYNPKRVKTLHGAVLMKGNEIKVVDGEEAVEELQLKKHEVRFTSTIHMPTSQPQPTSSSMEQLHDHLKKTLRTHNVSATSDGNLLIDSILLKAQPSSTDESSHLDVLVSWSIQDEELGSYITDLLRTGLPARAQ